MKVNNSVIISEELEVSPEMVIPAISITEANQFDVYCTILKSIGVYNNNIHLYAPSGR